MPELSNLCMTQFPVKERQCGADLDLDTSNTDLHLPKKRILPQQQIGPASKKIMVAVDSSDLADEITQVSPSTLVSEAMAAESSHQVTPKKSQENWKKACLAKRRLRYHIKTSSVRLTAPPSVEHMPISNGAKLILEAESKNFSRHPSSRDWTIEQKCFYLGIMIRSPKTYRFLRSNITAPTETILKSTLKNLKLEPGISPVLLKALKMKSEKMNGKEKLCNILLDEIYTNKGLYYNNTTDRIEGFKGLWGGRGAESDWKMPVAFYAVSGTCPADIIAQLLPEVIRAVRGAGLTVLASVSDQGATNRAAIYTLRSKCEEGQNEPAYKVDEMLVTHLWDVPHLFKNIRNNFMTADLEFGDKKVAKWSRIIDYFKLDEGLFKTSKLTYRHLCPLGKTKMRVDFAAHVLSEQTSCGMKTFNHLSGGKELAGSEATAEMLLTLDRLFDATNGPGRKDKIKSTRKDVTPDTFHHAFWRQMIYDLKKITFIRKSTNERYKPPCLNGYIDTLLGLQRIWSEIQKYCVTTLKLRHFNQDPLENYFGQIRQTCGDGSDPILRHFIAGMKICLVQQITNGRDTNCQSDPSAYLADLKSLIQYSSPETHIEKEPSLTRGARPEDATTPIAINILIRQAPSLTCATICSKLLQATNRCATCIWDLSTEDNSSDFTLQLSNESTASLNKPSHHLRQFYIKFQELVVEQWQEVAWKDNVSLRVSSIMEDDLNWISCAQHAKHIKEKLTHLVATRAITLKCSSFNSNLKAKKVKPARQAQILKGGTVPREHGVDDLTAQDWTASLASIQKKQLEAGTPPRTPARTPSRTPAAPAKDPFEL
ncbi:DNA transposase [Frankliniella fusca]|uniref:DNA transposase n=1 Tax=Frankliniella fusca TaxID=407009 RepID=A0AAE1HXJ1_9NEOP|nr:DNA transposase [Frankliniella fusca]